MKKILGALGACVLLGLSMISCSSTGGVYADVIGFNDDVYQFYEPYNLQDDGDVKKLSKVIYDINKGHNTAEYYAVDVALDRIAEMVSDADEDSKTSYYLILLTDGLDNVSRELARNNGKGNYASDDAYAAALQKRMTTILNTKRGSDNTKNVFQAYPIMVYGADLRESYTIEECREKLLPLAGAQNANRPNPIVVEDDFGAIQDEFAKTFIISSFSFEIPKGYTGRRIRMEVTCKDSSEVSWFEGDFEREIVKKKERYVLKNITCSKGFSFDNPSGVLVSSDIDEDEKTSENVERFTISNIRNNDKAAQINPYTAVQRYYDGGKPRINSEYQAASNKHSDAYILFVLDTSDSLRDKERQAKDSAIKIIDYVKQEILGENKK